MIDLSTPLDISNWKQKGQELALEINKQMEGMSESLIFSTLPSKIQMTQSQYDDLMKLGNLPNMYYSEDRMYRTPHNIMEVRVANRTKLTFKEAQELDDKQFNEWEKSTEGERDE